MIDDTESTAPEGVWWHAAPADVHVRHPFGARFGLRVADLAHLSELEAPAGGRGGELAAAMAEVLDDERWIADLLAGESPDGAPVVREEWRSVALVAAAEQQLSSQLRPDLLDLDRAIALDRVGAHTEAQAIAARRHHTIVEVVELLHDAGISEHVTVQADLVRLLDLIELTPLRMDLQDAAASRHRDDDAIEKPFRDVLTAETPPAVWNSIETAQPAEHELRSAWRTHRRIRAAERALTGLALGEQRRTARVVLAEELPTVREELGARTMRIALERVATPEVDGDPEPLLAELVHCLLTANTGLEGGLLAAMDRDADTVGNDSR